MTEQDLQNTQVSRFERIVDMAVNGLDSDHFMRAYRRALVPLMIFWSGYKMIRACSDMLLSCQDAEPLTKRK